MKPIQTIYPITMYALGVIAYLNEAWRVFGGLMWILATVVFGWIVVTGLWAERSRYLDSLASVLRWAKDVDIDKLSMLGVVSNGHKKTDRSVHVDVYQGTRSRHFDLPVDQSKLQVLSGGLLSGRPFSEREWSNVFSSGEFRHLRSVMREKGLIVPANEKDYRQGFILSDAGREFMHQVSISPTPQGNMA